ncbi:hypothetical protein D3C81_1766470 [compost metagenome]
MAIRLYKINCGLLMPSKIKAADPTINIMVMTGFKWNLSAKAPPPIAPTIPPILSANRNNMLAPSE